MTVPVQSLSLLSFSSLKHSVLALFLSTADKKEGLDPVAIAKWLIHLFSAFSLIIPLWFGYQRRSHLEKGMRLLLLNLFIALMVELTALVLLFAAGENFYIYSLFTPVEFIIFVLMFRFWNRGRALEKFLTASIPVFLVVWLGGMIWAFSGAGEMDASFLTSLKHAVWGFENYLLSAISVFFIICAITTLFAWLHEEDRPLFTNGMFWVTAAVLIYYSGNLFVFTLMELILETENDFWYIHSAVNLLKNLLYALGFYQAGKGVLSAAGDATGAEQAAGD
jgi:hypothetical protein